MTLIDGLIGVVGVGSWVLPGYLVARAGRVPQPVVAGFVAGAVVWMNLLVAFDALRVPFGRAAVVGGWAVFTLIAVWLWRRAHHRAPAGSGPERFAWSEHGPFLAAVVPMLAVVAYRACFQPLYGADTIFRWNYLAEQMFARGSLGFYPPVSAADYEIYSWPDGIPPVVATLYFWCYAIAGATRPTLTSAAVILQFVLLLAAVYALGRKTFSIRVAVLACALVACTPMIGWATSMGQETGLTALALVSLLYYLPRSRAEESDATLVFAALAATLGALAREYGLAMPLFGFGVCLVRRLSPRACRLFVIVTMAGVAPWYVRNWILTGNPLFNLALGNLLPVNQVHAWLNDTFLVAFGWSHLPREAGRLAVTNCLAGILGAVIGAVMFFREARALLAAILLMIALWAASLGYTAAGFTYSLRVLSPALALAAVLGGAVLARAIPRGRFTMGVALGLFLFATDAALRALTLPANVYRLPPAQWLTVGNAIHEYHERPIFRELVRVAGRERMLVLGPNALLTTLGARTVPLWSPEVIYLYDATLSPAEISRRLLDANIGFVLLNTGTESFLAHSRFFRDPAGALQTIWADADMVLLRVRVPERK